MQKITRAVPHKPVRPIANKRTRVRTAKPAGTRVRRAKPVPAGKPAYRPTVTRVTGDVELIAPEGCRASVLVKLVDRDDGHRYYAWWAMVGRNAMDACSVRYKFTGEDTIRFDLPDGMPLSAEALQPHLAAYLANQRTEAPDTPIIRD